MRICIVSGVALGLGLLWWRMMWMQCECYRSQLHRWHVCSLGFSVLDFELDEGYQPRLTYITPAPKVALRLSVWLRWITLDPAISDDYGIVRSSEAARQWTWDLYMNWTGVHTDIEIRSSSHNLPQTQKKLWFRDREWERKKTILTKTKFSCVWSASPEYEKKSIKKTVSSSAASWLENGYV